MVPRSQSVRRLQVCSRCLGRFVRDSGAFARVFVGLPVGGSQIRWAVFISVGRFLGLLAYFRAGKLRGRREANTLRGSSTCIINNSILYLPGRTP